MIAERQPQLGTGLYYTHKKRHNENKFQLLAFNLLMLTFVAIAFMQMFELNHLLAEAKDVKGSIYPISGIQTKLSIQNEASAEENIES